MLKNLSQDSLTPDFHHQLQSYTTQKCWIVIILHYCLNVRKFFMRLRYVQSCVLNWMTAQCKFKQITENEAALVELETRGQSSKKSWFAFRSGRLTASLIRNAVKTNHALPSQSLIKKICYPELYSFSTKATRLMYNYTYMHNFYIQHFILGGAVIMKRRP